MNNSGAICNVNGTYLAHPFLHDKEGNMHFNSVRADSDSRALQRTPATQAGGCQSPAAAAASRTAAKIICTLFLFSSDYNTGAFAIR